MADADFPSDFERDARRQERAVDEYRRRQELEAEVERLRADRAALLGLWIVRNGDVWQIRTEAVAPPTYPTQEEAEEAVLAYSRKRGTL